MEPKERILMSVGILFNLITKIHKYLTILITVLQLETVNNYAYLLTRLPHKPNMWLDDELDTSSSYTLGQGMKFRHG